MSNHVVIVGAGPGGLASALQLARAGAQVTVLEQRDRVGGRTSAIEQDGFRFDTGPTFFLYPRILSEIFESVGLDLDQLVQMVKLDPNYRLMFEGSGLQIDATGDVPRMQQQIARISPRDAEQLPRYLNENRQKLNAFKPVLETPFLSWRDMLRPSVLKSLPWLRPTRSVDSDLKRYFKDPRVRLAFSFQSKYLGMSPFKCPSLFTILSFLEYEYGVFHPIGGCARLCETMAQHAKKMGVKIHLNEPVTGFQFKGKKPSAAITEHGRYPADAVLINSDFAQTMTRLVPDHLRRRWTDRKIASKKFSCSTFMMYLGIEGRYDTLPHHTIYLAGDYKKNLHEIEKSHELSANPSIYVQNACVTDPGLAPEGCSTLYVLAPVSHQHANIDWPSQAAGFRRTVLDQLKRMGLNDVEQRIRTEKVITPDDWQQQLQVYRGATFNLAHSFDQMLLFRPRNRFEDLESVYLVGGGTHPGSGLPVIFESSRITSRLMIDDMGLTQTEPSAASMSMFAPAT